MMQCAGLDAESTEVHLRCVCVCVCSFLVSTEAAELPVAVVLNKADLVTREHCQQMVQEVCIWRRG